MSNPQTLAATMADAACAMLRTTRALVESQRRVDLDGLQDTIGRLCAACLDLPPDDGRTVRPQLVALLAELEALSLALRAGAEDRAEA